MKWILFFAIIFGISAFILDAFFAHGLRSFLGDTYSDPVQHALSTAARYQLTAAIFLIATIVLYQNLPTNWIIASQSLTILGVLCFSLTIYLKHLVGMTFLSGLAPVGGISFMLSFCALLPLLFLL